MKPAVLGGEDVAPSDGHLQFWELRGNAAPLLQGANVAADGGWGQTTLKNAGPFGSPGLDLLPHTRDTQHVKLGCGWRAEWTDNQEPLSFLWQEV